jgi:hypothetical protein
MSIKAARKTLVKLTPGWPAKCLVETPVLKATNNQTFFLHSKNRLKNASSF